MTPAQLKELKQLCAEATPPIDWRTGVDSYTNAGSSFWWARTFTESWTTERQAERDAAFIAAARIAVPELIAEVERLRGLVKQAEWFFDGDYSDRCTFCDVERLHRATAHRDSCPAFTPEGEVK